MEVIIHYDHRSVVVESDSDRSVFELAREAGWPIKAGCGGTGSCGRCKVQLGRGSYRVGGEEVEVAAEQHLEVLSCITYVLSNVAEIHLPEHAVTSFEGARIADEIEIPPHSHHPRFNTGYGLAIDIGTTTVVVALIELATETVLQRESLYNQQLLKAEDVISRISFCGQAGGLDTLQDLIVEGTLNPLIHKLCAATGVDKNQIVHVGVAGNTVMMHLLYGLSPTSIGVIPFAPLSRTFECAASELNIDIHPAAPIEALPAISGYVGGDITADLLVMFGRTAPSTTAGLEVLIDIGTNGEMVARSGGKMTACATAAGPAFEGAGLKHGARAASGAIDKIRFTEKLELHFSVIGDGAPMGLCGSAIIDFIAEGFRQGLISPMGRFDLERLRQMDRYVQEEGMHACLLVPENASASGRPITVTEGDVAEILKAKAAIYGGLKSLLAELGCTIQGIDRLILAGGFARHIHLQNAITLGLLPDIALERIDVIGNGSLAGAALFLLNHQKTKTLGLELMDRPDVIWLNQMPHFTSHFEEALAIPHLDEDEFPSVTG